MVSNNELLYIWTSSKCVYKALYLVTGLYLTYTSILRGGMWVNCRGVYTLLLRAFFIKLIGYGIYWEVYVYLPLNMICVLIGVLSDMA